MVGPAALDFLTDFFCRNSASVEGVLSTLQLAHLKHFDEPLSIFTRDERLDTSSAEHAIEKLSDPKAASFLVSLFSRAFGPQELASNEDGWPVNDVAGLLASVADARADFRSRLRRLKLAFGVMRKVQKVMLDLGYRGAGSDKTPLEMMSASLRGGLAREGKYLGMMTRSAHVFFIHLSQPQNLIPVFAQLRGGNAQETVRRKAPGLAAGTAIVPRRDPRSPGGDSRSAAACGNRFQAARGRRRGRGGRVQQRAGRRGVWGLARWLLPVSSFSSGRVFFLLSAGELMHNVPREHIINLEDLRLWEIWYTGSTPFPSEVSPRPPLCLLSLIHAHW